MLQPIKKFPKNCSSERFQANKRRDAVVFITNESNCNILQIFNPLTKNIQKITIDNNYTIPVKYKWLEDNNSILLIFSNENEQQVSIFDLDTKERTKLKIEDLDCESALCFNSIYTELCYVSKIKQRRYLTIYNLLNNTKLRLKELKHSELENIAWTNDGWIFYSILDQKNHTSKIEGICTKNMKASNPIMFTENLNATLIEISNDGTYLLCQVKINDISCTCIYDILTEDLIQFGECGFDEYPVNFSYDERNILAIREYPDKKIPVMYSIDSKAEQILPFDGSSNDIQFCLDDEFIIYSKQLQSTEFIISLFDLVENNEETILNLCQN